MIMALHGVEVKKIKRCVFCLFFLLSEVKVPSVIILNTSNEQYFLPSEPIETMEQLVQFISDVLNGSAQVTSLVFPLDAFRLSGRPFLFVLVQSKRFHRRVVVDFKPL